MSEATMIDVMHFFEMKPATFKVQWAALTPADKAQLKAGLGGTPPSFTY